MGKIVCKTRDHGSIIAHVSIVQANLCVGDGDGGDDLEHSPKVQVVVCPAVDARLIPRTADTVCVVIQRDRPRPAQSPPSQGPQCWYLIVRLIATNRHRITSNLLPSDCSFLAITMYYMRHEVVVFL